MLNSLFKSDNDTTFNTIRFGEAFATTLDCKQTLTFISQV